MEITFVGEHHTIGRVVTPYYSLNQALRGGVDSIGWPTRTITEIFGPTGAGKTTFALDILSILSKNLGDLSIAALDLEIQDENMVRNVLTKSGYRGKEFRWIDALKKQGKILDSDEAMLGQLVDYLYEEPPYLTLLDSIASISPVAEQEGDIGNANMGRRAGSMAQFTRKIIRALRTIEKPSALIMTNHQYIKMQTLGGATVYFAPGGLVKENEAHLRLQVKVPYLDYITSGEGKKEGRWDDGWILQCKVDKNRVGIKERTFQVFIVGGWGIHKGLTDLVDCLALGIAHMSGSKVELDGRDYGSLKKIIAYKRSDDEFFAPFGNALLSHVDSSGEDEEQVMPVEEKPKKRGRPKKRE